MYEKRVPLSLFHHSAVRSGTVDKCVPFFREQQEAWLSISLVVRSRRLNLLPAVCTRVLHGRTFCSKSDRHRTTD